MNYKFENFSPEAKQLIELLRKRMSSVKLEDVIVDQNWIWSEDKMNYIAGQKEIFGLRFVSFTQLVRHGSILMNLSTSEADLVMEFCKSKNYWIKGYQE